MRTSPAPKRETRESRFSAKGATIPPAAECTHINTSWCKRSRKKGGGLIFAAGNLVASGSSALFRATAAAATGDRVQQKWRSSPSPPPPLAGIRRRRGDSRRYLEESAKGAGRDARVRAPPLSSRGWVQRRCFSLAQGGRRQISRTPRYKRAGRWTFMRKDYRGPVNAPRTCMAHFPDVIYLLFCTHTAVRRTEGE